MRKEVLLTIASGLLMSSTALAQTCATPPSCESLGFIDKEADCAGGKMLKCPFDLSKVFCGGNGGDTGDSGDAGDTGVDPADSTPGMIYYSDGTVSADVIEGKTPVGVVAYNKDGHRFVVALTETSKEWGERGNYSGLMDLSSSDSARRDFNGRTNTQHLISDTKPHPAAEYCNTFKAVDSGKGSSGWYLPAAGELSVMTNGLNAINDSLSKLSETQLSSTSYWSSSGGEYNFTAWLVNPYEGRPGYYMTSQYDLVRCVLAF